MDLQWWSVYDTVMRIASLLGILLLAAGVLLTILSVRKNQLITPRSLLISGATPLLMLVAYTALMPAPGSLFPSLGLFLLGAAVGSGWAFTVRLRAENGQVLGKRSFVYLIVWFATFAATQVYAASAWYRWVGYLMPTMYFSTSLAVALNVVLLLRGRQLAVAAKGPQTACPACGTLVPQGTRFCVRCGTPLA